MLKNYSRFAAVFLLTVMVAACAALQIPQAKTFDERMAGAIVSVTSIRQTATILVSSHLISSGDAQNIQNQANNARDGLDIARVLHETLPTAADQRLEATLVILQALQTYVDQRKAGVK